MTGYGQMRNTLTTLYGSPSTITRELQRNTPTALPYGSHTAQLTCASRRVAARPAGKLDFSGVGWATVRPLLDCGTGPRSR